MTSVARERYDDIVDAITGWHTHCRASKVFGMPCVKRSGRVVFGLAHTGMVFKLTDPAARARALSAPGAHLFDPSGRGEAFRQWVVVPPDRAEDWEALAYEAAQQDHSLPPGLSPESVAAGTRIAGRRSPHARCVNQDAVSRSR
jgi:hypothetical protein